MIKQFEAVYLDLEKALKADEQENTLAAERIIKRIRLIRANIGKLRAMGIKYIKDGATEVEYFRDVWPAFYAKLLLNILVYRLGIRRGTMPLDSWPEVVEYEEKRVNIFFVKNRKFWQY